MRKLLVGVLALCASAVSAQTVSVIVGKPNRVEGPAGPASAQDLSAIGASLIEEYETFSVARVSSTAVEHARANAAGRGLRFEAHPEWDRVELPNATFTTAANTALPDGVGLWVVKFVGPERAEWGEAMAIRGLRYIQYHAHHAAVVHGDAAAARALAAERYVAWVRPYAASAKMQPRACQGDALFTVQLVNLPDNDGLIERLRPFGVRRDVSYGPYRNIDVALSCDEVPVLLAEGGVVGVEARGTWVDSGERESVGVTNIETIPGAPTTDSTIREPWQTRWQDLGVWRMYPRRSTNTSNSPSYTSWLSNRSVLDSTNYKVAVADLGLDGGSSGTVHPSIKCWDGTTTCTGTGLRSITWQSFVTGGSTNDVNGHGTATASAAVGYGTAREPLADSLGQTFAMGMGVGPRLGLVVQKIYDSSGFTSTSMTTVLQSAKNAGAFAQSQSRNEVDSPLNVTAGVYHTLDQEYDTAIKTVNLPMTISAGNIYPSGWDTNPPVNPNYEALTVVSPALAKNVITMGGTETVRPLTGVTCPAASFPTQWFRASSSHDIGWFSRRGTATGDGRIKPELVAPASLVSVARRKSTPLTYLCTAGNASFDTDYQLATGTSFASPQAAAAIALVNMKQGRTTANLFTPAMMKAALVGGAYSIKGGEDQRTGNTINAIPDIATGQGYGRLYLGYLFDANWTKTFLDEGAMSAFTDSGQQRTRTFTIADQSKRTVIALAWSDFASAAGSPSPALTRDLDLEVFLGNCTSKWGNSIDPSTETTPSTCFVTTDTKNNVEIVVIPPYSGATFTVYVTSKNLGSTRPWNPGVANTNVTTADQPYAVFALNAY